MSIRTLVAALFCGTASAQVITVPGDVPTIQGAIDLAQPGDSVLVDPGTYFEFDLSFGGKAITVASTDGAAVTIVDAAGLGRGAVFDNGEGPDSVLAGFTIQNGRAPDGADGADGPFGGTGSPGENGGDGGGILIAGASPTIVACVLTANSAGNAGAGGDGGSDVVGIAGAPGGTGGHGGGIAVVGGSPAILDCSFLGNVAGRGGVGGEGGSVVGDGADGGPGGAGGAGGCGGGLAVHGGSPRVERCAFRGNRAGGAAGGGTGGAGGLSLIDGGGKGGDGGPAGDGGSGGGVAVLDGSPSITSSLFHDNAAWHSGAGGFGGPGGEAVFAGAGGDGGKGGDGGDGGALHVASGASLSLLNATAAENTAGFSGPGGGGGIGGQGFVVGSPGDPGSGGVLGAGGAIEDSGGGASSSGTILWANEPDEIAGSPTVSYSDVQGGFVGTGNVDADPLFVDLAGGDLRVLAGSPVIDAADSTAFGGISLTASTATVSAATGGTVDFALAYPLVATDLDGDARLHDDPATIDTGAGPAPVVDMGAYEFGAAPPPPTSYWLLGTLSGTSPGFPFGGLTIPLNVDAYFLLTVNAANTGPFVDTLGGFGPGGTASASIAIPPGPPGWASLTAHHAFTVFEPSAGLLDVSAAIPLDFEP